MFGDWLHLVFSVNRSTDDRTTPPNTTAAREAVFYCLEKSMGAAQQLDIYGAKGGSDKPKTPTEAPDSLRSVAVAKILIAMGEGEFAGNPTARDIYLDNTPLQDPQGNMNFPNVKWEWRTGAAASPHGATGRSSIPGC